MCYSLAYLNFTFTPYLQTIKGNKIMGTTKSTNWQEVYQNKQNEIIRIKRIYYDTEEALVLPRHPRYYYDWLSSQYNSYPMKDKLRDLGFLVSQGFDLIGNIRYYKKEREEIITSAISQTFIIYILYMRYGECPQLTDFILRKLSERQLIKLFMDEVTLRFDLSNFEVKIGGWRDGELLVMADGESDKFFKLVTGVEMTKKILNID